MTAVVAGTGRSGTEWLTRVFNDLGHPAMHEHFCGGYGMEHYLATGGMRDGWAEAGIEVSHLASTFYLGMNENDRVAYVTRNPWDVATSWWAMGQFSDFERPLMLNHRLAGKPRFWDFLPYDHLSSEDDEPTRLARTLWQLSLSCEMVNGQVLRMKVERLWNPVSGPGGLRALCDYLGLPTTHEKCEAVLARNQEPVNSLEQRDAPRLRVFAEAALRESPVAVGLIDELARRYGYA